MTEQQQQKQRAIDLLESRYRGMENASLTISRVSLITETSMIVQMASLSMTL
jgi:hypothetical protein